MDKFLTAFELGLLVNVAVFVLTLAFSQKIKDFLFGVPTDLRTGLKAVESNVLADVKNYQSSLISKITPPVLKAAAAPAPTPPAAPAATPPVAPAA